ncbi:tetratricopeptide repeat protein, partial [Azospirillum brasilense]|nr:tetratricopeptide repeat protein [Azospirillum brasilense]
MSASRDSFPSTLQETLAQAVVHHQNGRLAEARPLYERVLRQVPEQSDALHLLGLLTAQAGDPEFGIALIRKAVAKDGAQPVFRLNLGRVLEAAGRWTEAAEAYGHAARLAPLVPDHHRLEAAAHAKLGRAAPAARAFPRLPALAPEDGGAANRLAGPLDGSGGPGPAG